MTTGTVFSGTGAPFSPTAGAATLSLTAVIAAVTDEVPRVLVARRMQHALATPAQQGAPILAADSRDSLPFGPFDPISHNTLDHGCRQWVETQTGLNLRYVEQLFTFGGRNRDPRELYGGPRVVTVAYLALTQEDRLAGSGEASWRDWYGFLPWEDWRTGTPAIIDQVIRPHLADWVASTADTGERRRRTERMETSFGSGPASVFDPVRALDRYEVLYEAGLVPEALRDQAELARAAGDAGALPDPVRLAVAARLGSPMALDNRRILASALARLRGKLAYRPVVFDLLPPTFTLLHLQRVVEALFGTTLHKQNFRRTIASLDVVEATGRLEAVGRGRPAELYSFRREALLERRTLGIGVPTARSCD